MGVFRHSGEVEHVAFGVRVLEKDAGDVAIGKIRFEGVDDLDFKAQGTEAGLDYRDGLRVEFIGYQHFSSSVLSRMGDCEKSENFVKMNKIFFVDCKSLPGLRL